MQPLGETRARIVIPTSKRSEVEKSSKTEAQATCCAFPARIALKPARHPFSGSTALSPPATRRLRSNTAPNPAE